QQEERSDVEVRSDRDIGPAQRTLRNAPLPRLARRARARRRRRRKVGRVQRAARKASLTACAYDSADFWRPCSTRVMPSSIALRIGPCFSPWYCGLRLTADSPKILPVGASLKNGFLKS